MPWWWPFALRLPRDFVVMRYTTPGPAPVREVPLTGLRAFVVVGNVRDQLDRTFPTRFLPRGTFRRVATLCLRCDVVFAGVDAAARVLPGTVHPRHDGRHPDVERRFLHSLLHGLPFFSWLPWREILERLELIAQDDEHPPREWVVIVQCICHRGRHRSVASAVCIARVLEQVGAAAVLLVHDRRDRRGRGRLCGDARCVCHTGPLLPDWDVQNAMGDWLNFVARQSPTLAHMEVETDHWPSAAPPDTQRAQTMRV